MKGKGRRQKAEGRRQKVKKVRGEKAFPFALCLLPFAFRESI
jgi:hypothetical protein